MDISHSIPEAPSYFSRSAVNARLMTGYFMRFLQWKFSSIHNIESPELRKPEYLWKPIDTLNEVNTTGILIDTVLNFNPAQALTRPAIIIARNSLDRGPQVSIGDKWSTPSNMIGEQKDRPIGDPAGMDANRIPFMGDNQLVFNIVGSHSIYCGHSTGAASETLGLEVWTTFLNFSKLIRMDIGLDKFDVGAVQRTGKLEENESHWVTPFLVTYSYNHNVIVRNESPILKAFSLATSQI